MQPKPSQMSGEYGAWFKDRLLVAAYPSRPPYPSSVIQLLAQLAVDSPQVVLDVGSGPGDVARRLAPLVERVDAVDFSAAMIELGQRLAGGDAANLRWQLAAVEDAQFDPPYALVTAGESLHWMAWDVVAPRFAAALSPNGVLAIVLRSWDGPPGVQALLQPIYERFSTVRDYRYYDLIEELAQRELFKELGRQQCGPDPWSPTVDEYLEARYSHQGLSRTHMGPEAVSGFDAAMRDALETLCNRGVIAMRDGRLQLTIEATVTWGKPLTPGACTA